MENKSVQLCRGAKKGNANDRFQAEMDGFVAQHPIVREAGTSVR
jgi:hypothetical protein